MKGSQGFAFLESTDVFSVALIAVPSATVALPRGVLTEAFDAAEPFADACAPCLFACTEAWLFACAPACAPDCVCAATPAAKSTQVTSVNARIIVRNLLDICDCLLRSPSL